MKAPETTTSARASRRGRHARRIALMLPILLCLGTGLRAHETHYLLGGDALRLGRAGGGLASPRSSAWARMNPAALADVEERADFSLELVRAQITMRPAFPGGNFLDGAQRTNAEKMMPSLGAVWRNRQRSWALCTALPLVGAIDYATSRNMLERLLPGNADRRLEIVHGQLVLAHAYQFDTGWVLGAGLHLSANRFRTDHYSPKLLPTQGGYEEDHALGAGFGLGIYRRWDRFAFGASYTSRTWMQSLDKYDDLLSGPIDLPHEFQAGIAYRITKALEVNLDAKYLAWSDIAFFGNAPINEGLGWRNVFGAKIGAEWQHESGLVLMAGFSHFISPVTRDQVFVNLITPAVGQNVATAGISIPLRGKMRIHVVYLHGFRRSLHDSGQGGIFSALSPGAKLSSHADAISLGLSFLL